MKIRRPQLDVRNDNSISDEYGYEKYSLLFFHFIENYVLEKQEYAILSSGDFSVDDGTETIEFKYPTIFIFNIDNDRKKIRKFRDSEGIIQYQIMEYDIRSCTFSYTPLTTIRELNLNDVDDYKSVLNFIMPIIQDMKDGEELEEGIYCPDINQPNFIKHPAVKKINDTTFTVGGRTYSIRKINPLAVEEQQQKALVTLLEQQKIDEKLKANTPYFVIIDGIEECVVLTNAIVKIQEQKTKNVTYRIMDRELRKKNILNGIMDEKNSKNRTKILGMGASAKVISSKCYGEIVNNQFTVIENNPMVFKVFIKPFEKKEEHEHTAKVEAELKITCKIDPQTHPVRLQTKKGCHQILMPYKPGKTLLEIVKDDNELQNLTTDEMIDMARAMLTLLHNFHNEYVHGDISLGNIKYDAMTKTAYLVDFNSAKLTSDKTRKVFGTPDFMAPEVRGRHGQLVPNTVKSDVFSLGVILDMIVNRKYNNRKDLLSNNVISAKDSYIKAQLNILINDMKTMNYQFRPNADQALNKLNAINSSLDVLSEVLKVMKQSTNKKNRSNVFFELEQKHKTYAMANKVSALEKGQSQLLTEQSTEVENVQAHLGNLILSMNKSKLTGVRQNVSCIEQLIVKIPDLTQDQRNILFKVTVLANEILAIENQAKIESSSRVYFLYKLVEVRKMLASFLVKLKSNPIFSKYAIVLESIVSPSTINFIKDNAIDNLDAEIAHSYLKPFYDEKRQALKELRDLLLYGCQTMSTKDIIDTWESIQHRDENGKLHIDHNRYSFFAKKTTATRDFIEKLKIDAAPKMES